MERFTDILGGLANSAATVIGAINGQRGQNTQLAQAAQEQAVRLENEQRAAANTHRLLIWGAVGLAGLLAVVFLFNRSK